METDIYVIVDSDSMELFLSGEASNSPYHKPKYFVYTDLRKAKMAIGVINCNRKYKQLSPACLYKANITLLKEIK